MSRKQEGTSDGSPVGREQLFELRLAYSGLDVEYLREARPESYAALAAVCAGCSSSEECTKDLASDDWESGLARYCPNAPTIDAMLAGVDEAAAKPPSDR